MRIVTRSLSRISKVSAPAAHARRQRPNSTRTSITAQSRCSRRRPAAKWRLTLARALANMRYPLLRKAALPPRPGQPPRAVPERAGEPSVFKHVVYIIKENRTYDQVLGDMHEGNGDPSLCIFGERITPNQHQLCSRVRVARQHLLLRNSQRRRPPVGRYRLSAPITSNAPLPGSPAAMSMGWAMRRSMRLPTRPQGSSGTTPWRMARPCGIMANLPSRGPLERPSQAQ